MAAPTKDNYKKLAIKLLILIFSLIALIWFVQEVSWVISLILISILIVYAINPLADWLEIKGFSRNAAAILTFLSLLAFIVGLLYLTIPRFYNEIRALADFAPIIYQHFEIDQHLEQISRIIEGPEFAEYIGELFDAFPQALEGAQDLFQQLTYFSIGLITAFFEFLIVMFLVFYLLRDIKNIKKGLISAFPEQYQKEANHILGILDTKVGQYLRGNLVRCLLVGILTGLGLFILGIRFYFILGLLAAVLNIIVYIGPYLAAFPAILIALTYSWQTAIIVAIMYIVIQVIDAFILTPILLGRAVDLRPFSIILALLIGGTLYGILGVLLAIPLAASIKVLINYYYLEKRLNKSIAPPK